MKFIKNILITLSLLVCVSCSDFLEHYPQDSVVPETYWQNEEQLRAALHPVYDAFQKDFLINWSETTAETIMWGDINSGLSKVSGGKHAYTDGFPFSTYWGRAYHHIYLCNNFLENYNRAKVDQDVKDVYAGEVKVIRAYLYYLLTTFWCDVPWVDKVITSDGAYVPRDDKEMIIDNLMEDLDWAASKLPAERHTGDNVGRIDRWGALAMKARIALQNGRNDIAAAAAKEIIDNSPYGLYKDYGELYQLEGDAEVNPGNNEAMIFSLYVTDLRMHNLTNETCCPVDYIRLNPAKSLVDAYLCDDGMPAKPGLEYYKRTDIKTSPKYKFPEEHYADYFQNRDPRMAMTMYVPGDEWPGGDDGDAEMRRPNHIFKLPRFSTLQTGRNGANGITGFYLKKYNTKDLAGSVGRSHTNINVLRYAEVLLIYAEAMYKIQGTLSQDQIDITINKLRNRVGMHPMLLTELAAWNLDLWTEIKRERRIELVCDGMRYADVMRWKEGELRFGRAITGPSEKVCINDLGKNPYPDNGVDEFGDVVYEKSRAEGGPRYFDPAMHYLWPVPYAERVKNPLLGQNPGWPE